MNCEILFVSPSVQDVTSLTAMLAEASIRVTHSTSVWDACKELKKQRFSAVLTEAELHDGGWRDILNFARALSPPAEVVVTDRWADARFWAEALNLGAYDLLVQPFQGVEVRRILSSAARETAAMAAC